MFKKYVLSFFVFLFFFASVYSVDLSLKSYTPDPAISNEFIYVDILVSNLNENLQKNIQVEFLENDVFTLEDENDRIKKIEILEKDSTITLKYKLFISQRANLGLNTLSFKVRNTNLEYDFDILIQDESPKIHLKNFKAKDLVPGEASKIELLLKNTNDIQIKDIFVELDVLNIEDNILNFYDSTNSIFIENLKPFEEKSFELNVLVNPKASSIPYLIPIKMSYKDSLNNEYNQTYYSSINIYSKPDLVLDIESIEGNTINLALANSGISDVKRVQVKTLEKGDYKITQGSYNYVGDLNTDDYEILQIEAITENEKVSIEMELTYYDSYNKKFSEKKIFEINNLKVEEEKSGLMNYIIMILLIIIIIVLYKYKKFPFHRR